MVRLTWTQVRILVFLFFGVIGTLLVPSLAAQNQDLRLLPGVPTQGELEYSASAPPTQRYRVSIPKTAFGVRFAISGARADLDLALFREDDEIVSYAESDHYNEEMYLSRLTEPAVEAGVYWIEVSYQWDRPPAWEGRSRRSIPYTITMDIIRPESRAVLQPGVPVQGVLEPRSGMMSAYEVTVPRGAEHLRVDLTGAQADADLYIFIGGLRADPYEAEYQSRSYSSAEWLILDPVEDRTTRYGIMVLSAMDEVPSDFSIQARIGTQAPPELLVYPTLPRADGTSLSGQLYATVELLDEFGGGSGCIVSPQGHILTNYHVIEATYLMGNTVMVNMSLDHRLPARELFNATIEAIDPQRDIALLKITSGIYGQPLPDNLRLPFFNLGDPDELQIGESLSLLGFPAVGGLGSRATITLSRGVVSGFENRGFGTIIKTDGEINAGNSGGAAVNSRGQLIGLPTQVVGADAGQIAYIYPVNLVPPKWLELISGR